MYIVQSYPLAILFCFITMLCWGSWGNTQKLAGKTWRYELFYWDYVIGILLFSLVWALTVGSCGTEGRKFLPDLAQASWGNIGSALWEASSSMRRISCYRPRLPSQVWPWPSRWESALRSCWAY